LIPWSLYLKREIGKKIVDREGDGRGEKVEVHVGVGHGDEGIRVLARVKVAEEHVGHDHLHEGIIEEHA